MKTEAQQGLSLHCTEIQILKLRNGSKPLILLCEIVELPQSEVIFFPVWQETISQSAPALND